MGDDIQELKNVVAQQVRQAAATQKVVDALIAEAQGRVDAIKESMSAKQVEVDDGVQEDPVMSFHSVQLNATQISAVYATSPPMMAEINVAEAGMKSLSVILPPRTI